MNEFELINKYLQQHKYSKEVILGIGDDAAIIKAQGVNINISTDMLVENQHFFSDVSAKDLAYKVLAVNLSDMAAMGAEPKFVLLSMGLPSLQESYLDEFFDQFFSLAKLYKFNLIGGDITKSLKKVFNITILGFTPVNKSLKRSGAKAGDDIWVSGKLGLASAALDHHFKKVVLKKEVFAKCEEHRLRPIPRINLGAQLLKFSSSAIDVSDGFAKDLGHILTSSGVGAEVYLDDLPTLNALKAYRATELYNWVVTGGDDYELIFTCAASDQDKVLALTKELKVELTKVGKITANLEYNFVDKDKKTFFFENLGFDHFA